MLSLRLLREADRYYRSGDAGLWYLSFRSACAVSAARQVYSEIGFLIAQKRGPRVGSTDLCDGATQSMGRLARRARFTQIGAGAPVAALVSCALAHGVEILKRSVNEKNLNQWRRDAVYSLAISNDTGGNRSCEPCLVMESLLHGPIYWYRLIRKLVSSLGPFTASPSVTCSSADWPWWPSQFYVIASERSSPWPLSMSISLTSELLGTTYGIPFGAYSYTTLLGPKWFDRVPLLIPLSWFTMSWAAWIIARRRTGGFQAVLLGTCLLVAWDLLLDPAMSRVTSYWIWGDKGNYYGMPWTNLLGWAITGFVLLAMLRKLAPEPKSDLRFSTDGLFRQFSSAPGILCAERLLDCRVRRHRNRSGRVPGLWFREDVPPAAGCIAGTV